MSKPTSPIDGYIGQKIRKIRDSNNVSASTVAEALDLSQQQLSRYECGQTKVSANLLYAIARYFDVPISWFFLGFEPQTKYPSISDTAAHYMSADAVEQLAILTKSWPQLQNDQRDVLLKLLETYHHSK